MPIKNFIDGEVQYLVQYEPFKLATTQVEPTSVSDMVSIDVQPSETPTTINYSIGAENNYIFIVNLKNITNNAILDVIVTVPPQLFVSDQAITLTSIPNFPPRQVINLTLSPQEQQQVQVKLDKIFLNSQSKYAKLETNLPITVRSRTNSSVITKNINVITLSPVVPPTTVNVN